GVRSARRVEVRCGAWPEHTPNPRVAADDLDHMDPASSAGIAGRGCYRGSMNAPPEAPAEAPVPRRRPFIAVSGWLLLLCLFLPTLRVCGKPTLPIEFPPTYVGYLGAAVIAVFAVARRPRTRQLAF